MFSRFDRLLHSTAQPSIVNAQNLEAQIYNISSVREDTLPCVVLNVVCTGWSQRRVTYQAQPNESLLGRLSTEVITSMSCHLVIVPNFQ